MKQKSIKGNLHKNCKVHYEKKNRFLPLIFDTKSFIINEKTIPKGNLLKLETCPKDTDAPPEKLKRKLLTLSRTRKETDGRG